MTEKLDWKEKESWVCITNFAACSKEEFSGFQESALKLCNETVKNVAIDLTGVDYLNSIKIGFLVKLHKLLYPLKRKFVVYNCSENLQNMAVSINLEEVIPFLSSENELQ